MLHPLRAQRWALSDLNPMMWPLAALAPIVAENRRACAADNPFRAAERMAADAVAQGLKTVAGARDRLSEVMFEVTYASPLARAAAGLADSPPPRPLGADPARRALAEREAKELRARAGEGTVLDGIVRLLLLAIERRGAMDELTYRALRALAAELPPEERVSPERMREMARRQALLLRLDRDAAVEGLRRIFATEESRRLAWTVVQRVAAAHLGSDAPVVAPALEGLIGPPPAPPAPEKNGAAEEEEPAPPKPRAGRRGGGGAPTGPSPG
jgi:hypothetical protein